MKKLKKLLCLSFVASLLAPLTGCNKGDANLEPNIIKDQYRTYYEIFVGAFSDSDGDGLGDFKGLKNRLDYLNDGDPKKGNDLGIDGIWLMPIMQAGSYHKYDVKDYCSIDKDYGTMEDFDSFLNEANKRGINVIIDLVLNHTSNYHPWFKEATEALAKGDLNNKYTKYYSFVTEETKILGRTYHRVKNTNYYYEGNFSPEMPELDMDNEEVKQEIVEIIKYWLNKGVGGFRLDAVKFIYYNQTKRNVEFLKWFMDEVRKVKEDAYVVGEAWSDTREVQDYYEAINCFDFDMSQRGGYISGTVLGMDSVTEFLNNENKYRREVEAKNPDAILNPFITNHDMDRAAGFLTGHDQKTAASLYLLSSGNPFIYYGEEIGMKGSREPGANTDANRRLAMLWGDNDTVKDPIGTTYNKEYQTKETVLTQQDSDTSLFKHYQKLIKIKNANPEIARGGREVLNFDEFSRFGGFLTTYNNSTIGLFHNIGDETIEVDLSNYTNHKFSSLRSYVGEGKASLDGTTLKVEPYTSVVLK